MIDTASTSMAGNEGPPEAAAALYAGKVMHARMKPAAHRFSYDVFNLLIDLDRLDEAACLSPLFSLRRFNLVSFHPRDHGPRDGSDLRGHIDHLLAEEGVKRPDRVVLLCYPRILGYVFNPLSVYYAYDADRVLSAVVYEVRNTFGGMHTYVLPVLKGQMSDAGLRQEQEKLFYVSPFVDMVQRYYFRLLPPGRSVRVRILEKDPAGPLLSASFAGEQHILTTRALLIQCLRIPFLTLKVMAAIHWEAFKIWRKCVRFHPRPTMGSSEAPQPDRPGRPLESG